jgi:hypothetical protein
MTQEPLMDRTTPAASTPNTCKISLNDSEKYSGKTNKVWRIELMLAAFGLNIFPLEEKLRFEFIPFAADMPCRSDLIVELILGVA